MSSQHHHHDRTGDAEAVELEPRLPAELEHMIFLDTAELGRKYIPQLMLVCRRVYQWLNPVLHSILMLTSEELYRYPPNLIASIQHQDKFPLALNERLGTLATYFQHILLQDISVEEAVTLLKWCPNVENLGLWRIDGDHIKLWPILQNLPLKALSVSLTVLMSSNSGDDLQFVFNDSLVKNVVYLEIIVSHRLPDSEDAWRRISLLRNLTYVRISGVVGLTRPALQTLLKLCSQAQYIWAEATFSGVVDARLRLWNFKEDRSLFRSWENRAMCGKWSHDVFEYIRSADLKPKESAPIHIEF
ncbi:hypothetical protein BJ165DRAFT_1490064 [Panaeolus papilionaceus]|nr:hypothetical protein BJ165DRAFT_1490064 [Panaeolus papilionaceus]